MKIFMSALTVSLLFSGHIAAAQNAAAGEAVFKKCKACHKVGDGAKNGVGPALTGVVGRVAGSAKGYKYSKTLKAANAAGLVWDEAAIAEYIADPKAYMKAKLDDPKAKPKMAFKLKNEQKAKDVAAYLAGFSPAAAVDAATTQGLCLQNTSSASFSLTLEDESGESTTQVIEPDQTFCTADISGTTKAVISAASGD
jgi:cytochrome c2